MVQKIGLLASGYFIQVRVILLILILIRPERSGVGSRYEQEVHRALARWKKCSNDA